MDLSNKTSSELVGLAIVKIQSEERLIRYKFTRFVELLHEYGSIDESTYNLFMFGTNDVEKISLCHAGLPLPLVNRLSEDGQLMNIEKDAFGNLTHNESLDAYAASMDDFIGFEIAKYIP